MVTSTGCDIQDLSRPCTCTLNLEVQEISVSDPRFKKLSALLKALEKELGRKATFEEFRAAIKGEHYDDQNSEE